MTCYDCFITFTFYRSNIFYPKLLSNRYYRSSWVMRRLDKFQPSFISQTYFAPTGWMPWYHQFLAFSTASCSHPRILGVVLTHALRKLSSPDDWYGFRSPYFAPPISTASNLSFYLPHCSQRAKTMASRHCGARPRGSRERISELSHF